MMTSQILIFQKAFKVIQLCWKYELVCISTSKVIQKSIYEDLAWILKILKRGFQAIANNFSLENGRGLKICKKVPNKICRKVKKFWDSIYFWKKVIKKIPK